MSEINVERTESQRPHLEAVSSLLKAGIACVSLLSLGLSASAETFVTPGPNVNLIGVTPNPNLTTNIADFGLKQQQEPSCVIRPANAAYIMCAYNDLRASDKPTIQGDSWIGYSESGDKGLTWRSYLVPGYKSHPTNTVQNVGFAADPSLVSIPGSYAVEGDSNSSDSPGLTILNYIGANRGSSVGVLVAQRFVDNEQEDERHNLPEDGHFIIADGSSGRFIDKPAFLFVPDLLGPQSYVQKSINVEGREDPINVSVASGTLVVAYAVFTGSSSVKVYVRTSVDLGETWSTARKLSESLNEVTGVSLSAIGKKVVATWRQKADTNNPDAVISAVSKNNNLTAWTKPKEVFEFCPFDQPATGVSFRSFAFPWTANDGIRFWTFAADRRFDVDGGESTSCDPIPGLPGTYDGIPRIVGMSSTDGINWFGDDSANPGVPFIVDANTDSSSGEPLGYQVMPSAVGTKGRIDLAWYDTRREALGLPLQGDGTPGAQIPLIYDYTSTDGQSVARVLRKADVWMTRLSASGCGSSGACAPNIESPVRVSQYPVAFAPSITTGEPYATPLEVEAHLPNHRLYASGTLAFKGDYIAVETPRLRKTTSGQWLNNSEPLQPGIDLQSYTNLEDVFVAWGDNRDVRVDYESPFFPTTDDGQVPYTPPGGPAQGASAFKLGEIEEGAGEPLVPVEPEMRAVTESDDSEDPNTPPDNTLSCSPGQDFSRSRDSNIYGSVVADAPTLIAPTLTKPLGTIQRMFPLVLNNPDTTGPQDFCLVISNQPVGAPVAGRASFFQLPAVPPFSTTDDPPPLTRLPVSVGPGSSESRAIFVFADPADVVRVDAYLDDSISEDCADDLGSDNFTGTLQNSIFVSDGGLLDSGYCDANPGVPACQPFVADEETHNISLASLNLQAPVIKASVTQALNLQALNLQAPALGALNLQALNLQAETLAALNLQALNLQALNLQALNLQALNLQALNLQALNLQALNLQALNLQALNLQALNLQALNLQALNLQAPSLGDGSDPTSPTLQLEQAVMADDVYYQDITYIVNTDANVTTTYSADIALDVTKLKTDPGDEDPVVQLIAWTPNSVNGTGTEDAGCGTQQQGFQAQVLAFTTLDALNLQALALPETFSPDNQNPYAGEISFTGKPNQKIGLTVRIWATGGTKLKLEQEFLDWVECMNDPAAADDLEFCSNEGVGQVIKFGASSQSCATSDKIDPITGEPDYDDSDCLNDEDEKIRPDIVPPIVDPVVPPDGFDPPTLPFNLDPLLDEITITWPITATDEDFNSLEFACTIGGVDIGGPTSIELVGANQDQLSATFEYSFSVGTTPVSCTVTDSSGNETAVMFNVDVFDVTAPDLTVPSNPTPIQADPNTGTAAPDLEAGVSASDAVDQNVAISCTADPYPLTVGPNTVTCTATDDYDNVSTATYTITVEDVTAPSISVPANFSINADPTGTASPVLNDNVDVFDAVDTNLAASCTADVYPLPIGANLITCTATDSAGNIGTETYTITVVDATPPILIVPDDADVDPVEADPLTGNVAASSINLLTGVSATDNVGVISLNCAAANDPLTVGPNLVTCTAIDNAGNSSVGSYTITVVDATAPSITVPSDFSVNTDPVTGTASPDLNDNVDVFDAVDTNLTATCTADVYPLPMGANLISCTATDTAGNTGTATYTITVVDATPPTINAPDRTVFVDYANMMFPFWGVVTAPELASEVTVTDGGVDITANANISCTRDVPPEQIPVNPDDPVPPPVLTDVDFEFIDGDSIGDDDEPYGITCTAEDLSGNVASASFGLTVSYLYDINLELPKGRARAGSTIPIDIEYREWLGGAPVDSSTVPVRVSWSKMMDSSCLTVDTSVQEESSGLGEDSGNSDFRYTGIWQFSWQTPELPPGVNSGYYRLSVAPSGRFVDNAWECVRLR